MNATGVAFQLSGRAITILSSRCRDVVLVDDLKPRRTDKLFHINRMLDTNTRNGVESSSQSQLICSASFELHRIELNCSGQSMGRVGLDERNLRTGSEINNTHINKTVSILE